MFRVILINRDIGTSVGNMPVPVSGRSGKLYGHAFVDVDRGGPIFEMTLEAYERDKFDIVGNPNYRCQWVPIFEEVLANDRPETLECANCGESFEPSVKNQIYCSYGCRREVKLKKQRALRSGSAVPD